MNKIITEKRILNKIRRNKKGSIFFAEDFLSYGDPQTINRALARLKEKDVLIRISFGIYLYPRKDDILGILYPSLDEVAKTIAKRDRARIIPTGVYALNKLGLSTQIPMNIVYLTDGSPRNIKIGKSTIKFKKTAPRNLTVKGEISGLVIQALKEIGKDNIGDDQISKIISVLEKEKNENIEHDMKLAPAWIRDILKRKRDNYEAMV